MNSIYYWLNINNQMIKIVEFKDFLKYFPEIELPITLTDETIFDFSNNNKILPQELIDKFIFPHLEKREQEFIEIIPCFKIAKTNDISALVFWEGGLMSYEYKMITFNKKGEYISGKVLSGTISDGKIIQKSVATIESDRMIYIVAGEAGLDENKYEASSSRAFNMELLASGEIIFSLDDKKMK